MKIVALAGGVGGARMVHGLAQVVAPEDLIVIVNIADDFEHFGLKICPDLDTVCYTLAGVANPVTGWGRDRETWQALSVLEKLGAPIWFHLGDLDLGVHLERTRRLKEGQPLSRVTADFCQSWGISVSVLPATDDQVQTRVLTDQGELAFQEYFVKSGCNPIVRGFRFAGILQAQPAPGVIRGIQLADVIFFCPSNPWVSIDPILEIPGVRGAIHSARKRGAKVTAVSPIIGGKTVKGPAAKMFAELGYVPSALAVARHYQDILTDFVFDHTDESLLEDVEALSMNAWTTDILMRDEKDRRRLAEEVLALL